MFLKRMKWAMLWALLILILCGIPGRDIPHISFLELLSFDKFVHAGIFFVLLILTVKGLSESSNKHPKKTALLLCIIYGGLLEVMQGTVFAERSADVYDFMANSFGSLVAVLVYDAINKKGWINFIK